MVSSNNRREQPGEQSFCLGDNLFFSTSSLPDVLGALRG